MQQSSRSLLIKKVDLTCKNKECTYITPHKANMKYTKPVPQACGRVQQRSHYQRDRVIEPVPLPPKKTNAYEELLRRAKLRKFESRDRRLQEFQHKKKLQQERKKYENDIKRQQFLLNRERMKREQAERLLEMEQRRHETRNRSYARTSRMYKDYRNYNEEESREQMEEVGYKRQVEKKNLLLTESTISLYGVDRHKLCTAKPEELESHKFRIYLPSEKSTKAGRFTPKTQPYKGPKCHKEMLVPMEQKETPKLQKTIPKRYPSEDLENPSYSGPTAVSMLQEAEAEAKRRNAKNCTSYKLSKSNLYAPSKIPIRRKKSKMANKNKYVAVCECGRGITESEAQLLDKDDSEAISSTREIHCFKVHAQQNESPQIANIKQPYSKIPVRKTGYNKPIEKHHCKSEMNEEEGTCCTMSTASSTDPAHESKTSIKTVPSSRRTALEATLSDDTTEDGIDVNTISLTTKTLQTNPIDRTSTSVQCENSRWSQEDGSGEDTYSETFMCEETSLTGLMNAASELPDVEIKIVDEEVRDEQQTPSENLAQELVVQVGLCEDTGNAKDNENQDKFQATQVPYAENPYIYNYAATGRSNHHAGFPMHLRQFTDPVHTGRTPFARFEETTEAFYQPNVILPTPCGGPAYFTPYCPTVPFYNYQWSANAGGTYDDQTGIFLSTQPEVILTPCNEEYEDVIILSNPYDSSSNEVPIVIFDVDEMYANQLASVGRDQQRLDNHSEMKLIEISESSNNLKYIDQIERSHPQKYISKEPKSQSSAGEFDVSKMCMHIRQIEMALKDKANMAEVEPQSSQELNQKEKRVSKNHNTRDQKASMQNQKKKKCNKSRKCQCGKRKNSPAPSENGTPSSLPSSITEPCRSMDIIINTFLVGKKTHKHCKKAGEHKKKIAALPSPLSEKDKNENSKPRVPTPEKPLESTSSKHKLTNHEENKDQELEPKKHKPTKSILPDSKPGTSGAANDRSRDRNEIFMAPGRTECYDFCMSLGKNESKHLEARILCTCCSCMRPTSPKHHALPNHPKNRHDFDRRAQENIQYDLVSMYETKSGRLEEPIKIRKRPAIIKCGENDTCCHLRRNRPRAFRRCYNSELRTSSHRAIHRNAWPSKAPRQIEPKWACKCTREEKLRDHSPSAKENYPPIISCKCHNHSPSTSQPHAKRAVTYNIPRNSYMYLERITESSSKSSSQPTKRTIQRKMSTIHKRNRDRTPHRRASQKKPKKIKKVIRKSAASGANKDENVENNGSSTVFGLYEPTEYSVVSLYRKSSDPEATFKANLFEIKRRYSHIITSSSSGFKRYSLNVLSPDSTSIRGFGILQERNENFPCQRCPSTITMYGSERPSIDEREFENSLELDDLNIEPLQNSSCYQGKHYRRLRTDDSEYGDEQVYFEPRRTRTSTRWDGRLYAGASCLIVPMSLSSLLQKVYSQTGNSLFKSSSSNIDRNMLNFSDHEDEPRLRGGGTYTPIFRNNQVESLIRRIAVLNNFQEAVNSVSFQVAADNEKHLPIKRYMTTKIIEKGNAVLETDAIQLCNVMDELRKHRQGAVRQKAEEKFEREVRDCLYKMKAKILYRTPINLPEDLPDDLRSALDESMDSLQHTLVEKLNQLCKDNTFSTSQFLYPSQSISYSLQEILNYLGSIDTETNADLCPLEILILSNTLAKHLLNEFLI